MSIQKTYTQSSKYDSKKKKIKIEIFCNNCKTETQHSILSTTELRTNYEHNIDYNTQIQTWLSEEYQIIQCRGCENIHFRHTHLFSEEINNPDTIPHENIYPNPIKGRVTIKDVELLPANLIDIYTETINTFNSNSLILTGMGIRAIVETVCKEQNVSGNILKVKIDNLVEKKILIPADADILHKLRVLGNKAAHEAEPHSSIQLELALEILEHLMKGIYILPHYTKDQFN